MNSQLRFGLQPEVINKIVRTIQKFPEVEKIVLYGSRAKGNFKAGSDIDLSLKGENVKLEIILKIENKLDDLLLPYMIDLSAFNEIDNQDLIDHINRIGVDFK